MNKRKQFFDNFNHQNRNSYYHFNHMNQLTLKVFKGFIFTFFIFYQPLLTLFTDGEKKVIL